jgi:GTPase SAR1 family protein
MAGAPSFPLKLLNQPSAKRLEYFKNHTVCHPQLREIDERLWRTIHAQIEDTIVFVFGPPGVGKTTLCGRIYRRLLREASTYKQHDKNRHAAALHIEADAPDTGNFNWRDFYKRALATLEEPFVAHIGKEALPPINHRLARALTYSPRLEYCEFRLGLEHALRSRRPAAFLIDDAQHIAKMASGRRLQDQMDVLKSIARKSRTLFVMLGTYELLNFRNLSGQLSRRSVDLHFPRYRTSTKDVQVFNSVLLNFQCRLPLKIQPDLMKYWEYCYVHSVGCVGILKDWLTRALDEALDENARTITIKMLERHALSSDQCETIAMEALEGEARLESHRGASTKLLQMLGFKKITSPPKQSQTKLEESSQIALLQTDLKVASRRVGRRKAKRDPV